MLFRSLARTFTLTLALCFTLTATSLVAQTKEHERLANAGIVMEEILNLPEAIPRDLLDKAECVIVIPSVTKVALGIGGSYGRGAMVCRGEAGFAGKWGSPAMYAIEAGSIGFQIGAESTDLVLLVMNDRGLSALLSSKVQLGANVSVAAGPKGRDAGASTDATLRAEMLSYSRSRGLFAGVSIEGASLRPDDDASAEIYGTKISAREIVRGAGTPVPAAGRRLVDVLQQKAARDTSTRTIAVP